jgi:capsid assembly protease
VAAEPLRLTRSILAAYRPGACVAIELGAPAGIQAKRPTPYARARAYELGGSSAVAAPAPASETAIIPVRGVLEQRGSVWDCGETCGYDTIEADILGALSDPGVGQGVLAIDSPGGDVAGLEQAIVRIRAGALAIGKPLLAYVDESCFSAAFWLAAGVCDGIYLPPSGRIGAVGSCVVCESDAGRLAKEGVEVYVGRRPAGKYKPNASEPFDDLGRARIDRLADEGAARFFAAIEMTRGVPAATVESWNGDTFTGADAIDLGLADGMGSMEEIIALAEAWPRAEAAA